MSDVRVYRQPNRKKYTVKSGEVRYTPNTSVIVYHCKLHHPDAEEMAVIRAELAAGETKKAVAIKHNIGKDSQRLSRLLKKYPDPSTQTESLPV